MKKFLTNKGNRLTARFTRGYTFIELIIVIAIFSIISSVVLFNFSDFSTNISLQNTTSDIALQIKEAQSDAISGRLNDTINVYVDTNMLSYYKPSFGMRFEIDRPSNFIKFTDLDKDRVYGGDCSSAVTNTECLKDVKINSFDSIANICVVKTTDLSNCEDVSILDVSFERPFPDAVISVNGDGTNFFENNSAQITLVSSKGSQRKIIINAVGNISVEQVAP